jgi:uncharacterized repeat protein (TIGR01451 family)
MFSNFTSDDYLYYTIRFQNLGTAEAMDISIEDLLNSQLDKASVIVLNASHDYVFTRVDDQLTWQFNSIYLPSYDVDEPNSHGYVNFKIKPLVGFNIGDIIPNKADIYFDFNPAVATNTFETEFVSTLSNKSFNKASVFVFPNPASNLVELKFDIGITHKITANIYDIQGKLVLNSTKELQNNKMQLNVSSLISGIYFLKIISTDNQFIHKLIIE